MATLLKSQELRDDLAFVEAQLRKFPDPCDTIGFMWRQRKKDLERQLSAEEAQVDEYAEVAILFDGAPVVGSEEIRLQFATKILENYQALVSVLAAEKGGAALKAKGQVPKAANSKLFIKDMLRGSVGFLLQEPRSSQNAMLPTVLKEAVEEASSVLRDLSSETLADFQVRADSLSPRAINAVKKIAKTLNDSGAEARIVGSQQELQLGYGAIASLAARLNEVEILEQRETQDGEVLGIFPDRQQYEFRVKKDNTVIYGSVSEDLDRHYLSNPASILLQPVKATFLVLTKRRGDQVQSSEKILETLTPLAAESE
ncbi:MULTISPECIES: hypothetical protein [unclassified Bradyrhizobium]|uniref:hypothetical protein n=1 Tax=unclassified Bradyrhizobium TaxID=2631580 RepID=UPI0028E97D37|nr:MULTISPECIES: hypothetical protein [unclassified Bradyrhizobium]